MPFKYLVQNFRWQWSYSDKHLPPVLLLCAEFNGVMFQKLKDYPTILIFCSALLTFARDWSYRLPGQYAIDRCIPLVIGLSDILLNNKCSFVNVTILRCQALRSHRPLHTSSKCCVNNRKHTMLMLFSVLENVFVIGTQLRQEDSTHST